MTPQDCYRLLQIPENADLATIKSAYRRRAFALHPDLHPGSPNAAKQFQRLNEAYVLLTRLHAHKTATTTESGTTDKQTREDAFKAYNRAKNQQRQTTEDKQQRKSAHANTRRDASGPFYYKQEDVLQDILKDPFAKKVFEDIYAQLKNEGSALSRNKPRKRKRLALEWGKSTLSIDLTQGIIAGIKNWLRHQMDYEQTVYLPTPNLVPGTKVRLNISIGLTGEKKMLEITLPPDFVVGRPIRLREQGRKFGTWRGDLYVRILAKTDPV